MAYAATLAESFIDIGVDYPNNGLTFQDLNGAETFRSYSEIERETARRAAALQKAGLAKGDRMGMVVVLPEDFVLTFLAALRIGVVPVPLYPPLYLSSMDRYALQTSATLASCSARMLVCSPEITPI